jgi:acetate kinase
MIHKEGTSLDEVFSLLNKRSGLIGVSGLTNDMRDLLQEIEEHQDRRAELAVNMFCNRIKKYIGAYMAELNGTDAVIFTAGIGENSAEIRKRVCSGLENLGIEIDDKLNNQAYGGKEMLISSENSKVKVYVIPTNEELLIARDTLRVVMNVPRIW